MGWPLDKVFFEQVFLPSSRRKCWVTTSSPPSRISIPHSGSYLQLNSGSDFYSNLHRLISWTLGHGLSTVPLTAPELTLLSRRVLLSWITLEGIGVGQDFPST